MKKYNIIIMSILSAIFLISGISNVNALVVYSDDNTAHTLPDLPSSPGVNFENYSIAYTTSNQYLLFYTYTDNLCFFGNAIDGVVADYYTFGCNYVSSSRQMYYYTISGDSWVLGGRTNRYGGLTDFIATSRDLCDNTSCDNVVYDSGYGLSPHLFDVVMEQKEVYTTEYMQGDNLGNLLTFYINNFGLEDTLNYDYCISEYNNTNTKCFKPIYKEDGIFYDNQYYYYYYNYLTYSNGTLLFTIYDINDEEVYSKDFDFYSSSLPDNYYYETWYINSYKYVNISDINNGSFGLTLPLGDSVDVFVVDINNNSKMKLEDTSYYVNSYVDNNVKYWEFNFDNNTNYYLTIYIEGEWWFSNVDYFLYTPKHAQVHLSKIPNTSSQLNDNDSVYQQCYYYNDEFICSNNNVVYEGEDKEYLQNSFSGFDSSLDYVIGTTSIFTLFITSLNFPIISTLMTCFFFSMIGIIILLFKH